MSIIDLHIDTLPWLLLGYDIKKRHSFKFSLPFFHLDIPRLKESRLKAIFLGLVSPPFKKEFSWKIILKEIEAYKRLLRDYSIFVKGENYRDIEYAEREDKIALFLGLEGLHPLGDDLGTVIERLEFLKENNVKYVTLVHFCRSIAGVPQKGIGSNPSEGLSIHGREIIERLNQLKILVDLSHINKRGFLDAIKYLRYPPIVSHTGIKGVYDHWRNIDDEEIKAVAERGGIIGIMFSKRFLGGEDEKIVASHFKYLKDKGGIDVVAIGSDFDGLVTPPSFIKDITGIKLLLERLKRYGFTEREIELIASGNVLRVLKELE